MKSHEIDYKLGGKDIQFVEIELDYDETVVAEAGAMMYMDDDIVYDARLGDGSSPRQGILDKMIFATSRLLTSESLFITYFTNKHKNKAKAHIAFAAPYPGKIVPVDLKKAGGEIVCQKDAFLCAALGTKISLSFAKKFGAGLFGREGFILQKLQGDGMAFIHAGGSVVLKKLNNQTMFVDTGCLVAFTKGITYDIMAIGGLKTMMFGGEGIFLTKLSGTGYVWLQSLPFPKLAQKIVQYAPIYRPPK